MDQRQNVGAGRLTVRRREALLGLAAVAAGGLPARAQSEAPLVAFLHGSAPVGPYPGYVASLLAGLKEQGFETDVNVKVEYRWCNGDYARMPGLAAEAVALKPAVVVAYGPPSVVRAAIEAVPRAIPVVFGTGGDPIAAGIVPDLAHPPANITGVANRTNALDTKRLELLHHLTPTATKVVVIVNPRNSDAPEVVRSATIGAATLGLELIVVEASTPDELARAFSEAAERGTGAVLVASDAYFNAQSVWIVGLAARHRLPAIYNGRPFTDAGGLMSYGANFSENYRLIGIDIGKILHGTKPADIPIIEPAKFELVINLKTAKALGITVPQLLLAQADEVIE